MFGKPNSPTAARKAEAKQTRRDHNARFNNADTDPTSPEYLASHDQVIAAEKAARNH
ncbi:hypothetical protein [Streptomyces sp. NPDC048445]|uniref:hypothetical protein n=1 Tax=Streptomyces sp. NPDC048445 TaxID=3365553 RepID=UPI003716F07C